MNAVITFRERARAYQRALRAAAGSEHAALGFALIPAVVYCLPLLRETPLSHDHATHLFKAWHFWEEMLGRWRLRGWSPFWAFGFPSDELVPCGGEAWVALFRALTLGQLSWLRTYALSFGGLLLFKTAASYWFARCFFGRGAAIACAWITMLDPGGMLEGGWSWHTRWGVWPVTLAMSFAQLSLVRLVHVLRGGPARDVLLAGAWLGAALLTHQMALPTFALALPLLLLDGRLRGNAPGWRSALRVLSALAFGFGLAAFFLVPFLARTSHTQDLGWLGESLPVVSEKLVGFQTFQGVWAPVHALALLGAWWALRRRVPGSFLLASTGALLILLASGTLLRDLQLARALPGLIKLESNRFLLVAKLFWFPLAGYAFASLAGPWLAAAQRARKDLWATLRFWVGSALALALVLPGYQSFHDSQLSKSIIGEEEREHWEDFTALLAWTRELKATTQEHYRIAYRMPHGEHLSTIAPAFDATPMYKVGSTPTQIFDEMPMTDETPVLEALSVKYLVSLGRLERPTLQPERRFGQLWVYRFTPYRSEPFSISGGGKGELLELSPERVRVRLSETTPATRLTFHIASFDRWRATLAGRVLPIATVPVYGVEYPMLMQVDAGDGEVVLEYVYRAVDWLGLIITLVSVPCFFAVWQWDRRRDLLAALSARLERAQRQLAWAALAAAVLVIVGLGWRTRTRERLLPPESIFHSLQAQGHMSLAGEACEETSPLSFRCGAGRVNADVVSGAFWGLHRCITTPDDGPLVVSVQAKLGSFLQGRYDPRAEGAGHIQVALDGEELASFATRPAFLRSQSIKLDTRARRGQSATLQVTLTGAALHCFDLAIED